MDDSCLVGGQVGQQVECLPDIANTVTEGSVAGKPSMSPVWLSDGAACDVEDVEDGVGVGGVGLGQKR